MFVRNDQSSTLETMLLKEEGRKRPKAMADQLDLVLQDFNPIGLDDVAAVKLMNRVDSKFVVPFFLVPDILEQASLFYFVQEIQQRRIANYHTTYWDTPDFRLYYAHINGKLNRCKVRVRTYVDTFQHFLEVKSKSNKGRTNKIRIPVEIALALEASDFCFLHQQMPDFPVGTLQPVLNNQFFRITLVSCAMDERLTIDFNLSFSRPDGLKDLKVSPLVIIELKQDKNVNSPIASILLENRVKATGLSKYCLGVSQLYENVKYNIYKSKVQFLKKQLHDESIFG
ncbi:polyphosphate polymerase domain-containing protein [Geofilum sp. OHC36d9]|uniref:polyphosphate polymerase domain-containing protein n=1 Tax=Geofilum sp. OHC36d9 TaxID=3458413 RepID=UPI00403424D0